MYNNKLYHHGIKGQKWGVRRFNKAFATRRLNQITRKAETYQHISDIHSQRAKIMEYDAMLRGEIAYSRAIQKEKLDSKQYQRYADFGRKNASRYMERLSKKYDIVYDVRTGNYSLREKSRR